MNGEQKDGPFSVVNGALRFNAQSGCVEVPLEAACELLNCTTDLADALKGLLAARDSVTQGQEKELYAEWLPKARAALAKASVS